MEKILISDNCDSCQYVSHAFSLIGLPLEVLPFEDCCAKIDTLAQSASIFINCDHREISQQKKIQQLCEQHHIFLLTTTTKSGTYSNTSKQHFLTTPFSKFQLITALTYGHNFKKEIKICANTHPIFEKLIGPSTAISKIKTMIRQIAETDTTVLLLGQSGSGKDVVASCIHYLSNRKNHALVPINCGAIPPELIESELFGHEKGAFTGASMRRQGRFEMAHQGTLFLDEIGDMPFQMQVKLLRVIQERKIEMVGGTKSISVDTRLIAATNKNLEEMVQQHHFREDLYFRINVFPIHVPSLSERSDDIPYLIDYHLEKIYARLKHKVIFTERAKQIMCEYSWPGNIRELENFLERIVILHPDSVIDEKQIDLPSNRKKIAVLVTPTPSTKNKRFNIKVYIAQIEQQLISNALKDSNGIVNTAAESLSLGRTAFIGKMKKYKLHV